MRLLTKDEWLQGKQNRYKVIRIAGLSQRSKSYLCEDEQNRKFRVKVYDGRNTMYGDTRKRFLSLPACQGLLERGDYGMIFRVSLDVFPLYDKDLMAEQLPSYVIKSELLPALCEGLHCLHSNGLLLRDIRPEHILYGNGKFVLCGFSDMASLGEYATETAQKEFGADSKFLAPEVYERGFSTASDMYALGMTILALVIGYESFDRLWEKSSCTEELLELINEGELPILWKDKLLTVIKHLLDPDPAYRWTEIQVTDCLEQGIIAEREIVRAVGRELPIPANVCGMKCWDYLHLVQILAHIGFKKIDETGLNQIIQNISYRDAETGRRLSEVVSCCTTLPGKIFRVIYTLNPSQKGFWCNGTFYLDSRQIAREAEVKQSDILALSELMKDSCLTFWYELHSNVRNHVYERVKELEKWECREAFAGVSRLLQLASDQRRFEIEGYSCGSLTDLLQLFMEHVISVYSAAKTLQNNPGFQAWAWAEGMQEAEEAWRLAAETQNDDVARASVFLRFVEQIGNDREKETARILFLKYSLLAPVTWLLDHIDNYEIWGEGERIFRQLRSGQPSESMPIQKMQVEQLMQLGCYQQLVSLAARGEGIRPHTYQYSFTGIWYNTKVPREFLESTEYQI